MSSMYETIMDLPLFKGIGRDQLSRMLEKTSVEFLKYEEGEKIALQGTPVNTVDFIINGRVKNIYNLPNLNVSIEEIISEGNLLGAMNLFGLSTNYAANSVAMGKVSMMRISKNEYINILLSDRIYLLNFVNYISAGTQRIHQLLQDFNMTSEEDRLKLLMASLTSKRSEEIRIRRNI